MAEAPSPPLAPNVPMATIETLLAGVIARLDGLDARFHGLDARYQGLEARLDRIERRSNVLIGLLGAIIVAMITADGLLWNAMVSSERALRQDLALLEQRLSDRMTASESRLIERIHNLELAFVRAGIDLPGRNGTPPQNDEQRSERDLSPGAGPAAPDALRPGGPPDPRE